MNASELFKTPRRILVIDDNPRIHEDIRKIIGTATTAAELDGDAKFLFGQAAGQSSGLDLDLIIDSAQQGQDGLAMVEKSVAEGHPYLMAFVDMCMPRGWDGIETIQKLWKKCPDLQIVICTAYSDKPWHEINTQLGPSANLLILKKPFDNMEVLQLVQTLTHKWIVTKIADLRMGKMEIMVEERTYQLVKAKEDLTAEAAERTEAQIAWLEAEERFHEAFESAQSALAILKADSLEHTDANNSYLDLVGFRRPQVIGHTLAELKLSDDMSGLGMALAELKAGRPVDNLEIEMPWRLAQKRYALISITPMTIRNQAFLLFTLHDTTELRQLEAQLRQVQKLDSIGQVMGGVAHDFNNILASISMQLDLLRQNPKLDHETNQSFAELQAEIQRAANLTRQLFAVRGRSVPQIQMVDLESVIQNILKMLRRLLGAKVNIQFENKTAAPPVVRADTVMLEQVLMNLAINARDAMPGEGILAITLRNVEFDRENVRLQAEGRHGKFIRLSVADTGGGMDENTLRHIFEPFFTTKAEGKGTGLGLATVFRIVKQHQGWIQVESRPGLGTTFHIFLPAQNEKVETGEILPLSPIAQPEQGTMAPAGK